MADQEKESTRPIPVATFGVGRPRPDVMLLRLNATGYLLGEAQIRSLVSEIALAYGYDLSDREVGEVPCA